MATVSSASSPRLGLARKVVVGFWQDTETVGQIGAWTRAAAGWYESQHLKVVRFGDNMRDVAVTEGDKVAAQAQLGYSVNTYGIGDLAARMAEVSDAEVDSQLEEYRAAYTIAPEHDRADSLRVAAKIEVALRAFGRRRLRRVYRQLSGSVRARPVARHRHAAADG